MERAESNLKIKLDELSNASQADRGIIQNEMATIECQIAILQNSNDIKRVEMSIVEANAADHEKLTLEKEQLRTERESLMKEKESLTRKDELLRTNKCLILFRIHLIFFVADQPASSSDDPLADIVAYAPSSFGDPKVWMREQGLKFDKNGMAQRVGRPKLHNYRPHWAVGSPIALLEPIFARFMDHTAMLPVTAADCEFIVQLVCWMSAPFGDEAARMEKFNSLLGSYLGTTVEPHKLPPSLTATDGTIHVSVAIKDQPGPFTLVVLNSEVKNELGHGGNDPTLQSIVYWLKIALDPASSQQAKKQALHQLTECYRCPGMMILFTLDHALASLMSHYHSITLSLLMHLHNCVSSMFHVMIHISVCSAAGVSGRAICPSQRRVLG